MNREFAIAAAPGIARRIVRLARSNKHIVVDPALSQLAETGLIAADRFPPSLSPKQREAIQYVTDCGYRSIVLGNDDIAPPEVILHTIALGDLYPVLMVVDGLRRRFSKPSTRVWLTQAVHLGYQVVRYDLRLKLADLNPKTILMIEGIDVCGDVIKHCRTGALVMDFAKTDFPMIDDLYAGLFKEFERAMIMVDVTNLGHRHWRVPKTGVMEDVIRPSWYNGTSITSLVNALFCQTVRLGCCVGEPPFDSHPIFHDLMRCGFIMPHASTMAPHVNVSTHLIKTEVTADES